CDAKRRATKYTHGFARLPIPARSPLQCRCHPAVRGGPQRKRARQRSVMPGIFRLGYLFYPWGFIVQLVALVHFVRRRPEGFWLWVIFFGGFLGALVYIVAEMLPDAG